MTEYVLSFKPATRFFGSHDPSAAISKDGEVIFGIEEERLSRNKHAEGEFPIKSIRACLDYADIGFSELNKVKVPYKPKLKKKIISRDIKSALASDGVFWKFYGVKGKIEDHALRHLSPLGEVKERLRSEFSLDSLPEIETCSHHKSHAASAFHPSGFEEALVISVDGRGEYDSTVIFRGEENGLERIETKEYPNSLGHFYGIITEFLGFRMSNGEGKVMGLAPYGEHNEEIESKLRGLIETGKDYDVTELTSEGIEQGVKKLEKLFNRARSTGTDSFSQWEKDLAFAAQKILEEIMVEITEFYTEDQGLKNVAIAGGVALNCKMNKRLMELDCVNNIFVQPIAHDAGLALGACMLENNPQHVEKMEDVYLGSDYDEEEIKSQLENNKIEYEEPDNLEKFVAEKIEDGEIIGWFQGRMEMSPRALGNRSILADPRTQESRDRINKFVKHREEWRPFAPSILEERTSQYLENYQESPYMIKTFDVVDEKKEDIEAVLHPGDDTTKPQTVRKEQNERYYRLLSEFEELTGVPALLNTSFNDHGEPIINKPSEAIKDFFGM